MKIALVQLNPTVGALKANAELIVAKAREAAEAGAELIVFPELALTGYPPEDLILKAHFIQDCQQLVAELASMLPSGPAILLGAPWYQGDCTYNAAVVYRGGKMVQVYKKNLLPNYGVFDEKRVFVSGCQPGFFEHGGEKIGIHICEDSWYADRHPCTDLKAADVSLVVNLSASPYHRGKIIERRAVLAAAAQAIGAPIAYCNLVGGQDELVFDGGSKFVLADGTVQARAAQFVETTLYLDTDAKSAEIAPAMDDPMQEIYEALKVGLKDYVEKNGFKKVIVAISGGIDSALVLAVAVDALGADRVLGLTMPSQYSSAGTFGDALEIAKNCGIEMHTLPIKPIFDLYRAELQSVWGEVESDVTEENLQARIRGNLVMALSNKFGAMVLTTGNKSEMAVGYCTIYGDMCGGFALIKDVPKTLVFDLCRWRNGQQDKPIIPWDTIERPPSAELRPDQQDSDSLPPYDILDAILQGYVEEQLGHKALVGRGFDSELVSRIIRLVDLNEYKRRQGAPGVKITPRAFGRDRRMPITNRYRG
jgi:NAD+ synthase (glutamine-hydrolysing)